MQKVDFLKFTSTYNAFIKENIIKMKCKSFVQKKIKQQLFLQNILKEANMQFIQLTRVPVTIATFLKCYIRFAAQQIHTIHKYIHAYKHKTAISSPSIFLSKFCKRNFKQLTGETEKSQSTDIGEKEHKCLYVCINISSLMYICVCM